MAAHILIERRRTGALMVSTDPPVPQLRKVFIAPHSREKRFWRAAGYAAELAAMYGLQMIDRTGRLTAEHCAALVQLRTAKRAEISDTMGKGQ